MPKRPKSKSDLTHLREALDLSQSEFARRLGVSASMIKKLEEGKRLMSQELTARIFAETGVLCVRQKQHQPFSYTNQDYAAWSQEVQFNPKSAVAAARIVLKLVELMLVAAARPGVRKSYQTFNAMILALEKVKDEFRLEKHIEAELRDRHSTETKLYTVRELRTNDLLAKMVDFKDDPKFKDDDTLPLTKTTGWLPAKELFNIWWRHRELLAEISATQDAELTEEAKSRLKTVEQQIEKELDPEVNAFLQRAGLA